jgi:pimeloyl-ACP methyl ester carboxylesterase
VNKKVVPVSGTIDYAVLDEGAGPAVLLLHGFPDSSYLWRHQIPVLTGAGFRVIAPDLRGFGDSSKPIAAEEYGLRRILGDVSELLRALDVPRAHVVGHDWGAAVAWFMAALMAQKVDHLAVLSVGHPAAYHAPRNDQRQKSWYTLLYQFEGVAEELLSRRNWALLREETKGGDVDRYVQDLSRPNALTAALNWYRANQHPRFELEPAPRLPYIDAPTLALWGEGDHAMTEDSMRESATFVSGPWRYERLRCAGHWIPITAPGALNELLVSFLGSAPTSSARAPRRRRAF